MISRPWPTMLPVRSVRIARPTDQLDEVVRFYREGLGLPELDRFAGHAGYRGVLLGLPGTQYHLEFTQHDHGSPGPAPSRDNLLVLYFDDLISMEQLAARLATLGHPPVEAENPYWAENGAVTVEDPDHWRVVLMPQPPADGAGEREASAADRRRPARPGGGQEHGGPRRPAGPRLRPPADAGGPLAARR